VPSARGRLAGTTIVIALLAWSAPASAQGVEVAPFGGYRFGGDLFELAAGHSLDEDGAPALGVVLDFPLWSGFQIEGLVSRQESDVFVPLVPSGVLARRRISVDQWHGGALQEFADLSPGLAALVGGQALPCIGQHELVALFDGIAAL